MTRCLLAGLVLARIAWPQQRVEIVMEKRDHGAWAAIDPATILERGEQVRFRFRTNFEGFFYVVNSGTSGSQTLLFPRSETGRRNNVSSGREQTVPATDT